jgi:O-antigen/teichoic acid export membrane protein
MSPHQVTTPVAIVALKTVTLFLGCLITYLSYKAYRRTGAPPLRYLSVGFGIVTLGALLAGVVDQVLQAGFALGQLVESALVALGFAIIVYSLYASG